MNKNISLLVGSSLAFSSIIGAGILFVPSSLIYYTGLYVNSVLAMGFVFAIFFSIMFYRISLLPSFNGLDGLVVSLIGCSFKNIVPTLLSSALAIGLPIAGVLSAKIISSFFEGGKWDEFIICIVIFLGSFLLNISRFTFFSKIQVLIVLAVFFSVLLLFFGVNNSQLEGRESYINSAMPHDIYAGFLIAILAFAGLENMPSIKERFGTSNAKYLWSMVIGSFAAMIVYLALIVVIGSYNDGSNESLSWLVGNGEDASGKLFSSLFILFAVLGNVVTWNFGMTSLLKSVTGSSVLKIQSVSTGIFIVCAFFLLLELVDINVLVSQVGAVFSLIYTLLVFAYVKLEPNKVFKVVAVLAAVFMVLILFSNVYFLLYALFVIACLYSLNVMKVANERSVF